MFLLQFTRILNEEKPALVYIQTSGISFLGLFGKSHDGYIIYQKR